MPKACGLIVFIVSTTMHTIGQLFTAVVDALGWPEYKSSTFSPLRAQVLPRLLHGCGYIFTAVIRPLFPTIHTTNKNNKKFYLNNLLLIYGKAV